MRYAVTLCFCLLAFAGFGQQGNSHVQKGNDAYRSNDFKTAAEEYQKALDIEPNNTAAKFNLANTQLRLKNAADAIKQYDNVVTTAPDTAFKAKALYNKGLAFIKQQNLEDAIAAFKQALSLAPADDDIRDNLQKALNEKRQQEQKNQQNKQQQKKDQPRPQQNQKPLNKQMMDQKFNELRNQEKQLQKQLQRKPQDVQPDKDW